MFFKQFTHSLSIAPFSLILKRTFIDARIKWVRDPFLDKIVETEKNLFPCLSLKNLLMSSPSNSLPISIASLHKPHLNLPMKTLNLILKYPSLFHTFYPKKTPSLPHVKLTPEFLTLHREEQDIHDLMAHRELAAQRICSMQCDGNRVVGNGENLSNVSLGLELVSWRKELAVPTILNKEFGDDLGCKRGRVVKFPMYFPPGFDLQKKVKEWVEEWQCLPYISPYEDAFHLAPRSDQAEKYTVAVLHEILSLLVSKKTEMKNVLRLGDYLGFGWRFKKALVHHPGIFYVSNKIRTQTVVLREAFRKDFLLEKHPLMGMRHRYIYLMNRSRKRKKLVKLNSTNNFLTTGVSSSSSCTVNSS